MISLFHLRSVMSTATRSNNVQKRRGRRPRTKNPQGPPKPPGYLDTFFAEYPSFQYDCTRPPTSEFYRLCKEIGWNKDDPDRNEAHSLFRDALVQEFNTIYGTDVEDINSWHILYSVLGIDPIPQDVETCRQRIQGIHVNIVDLVQAGSVGGRVRRFSNLKKLQDYTIQTGKFFPRENAYAGGLLRFLLREITGTYLGKKQRG